MKITQYSNKYRGKCLAIFDSNCPNYFSFSERDQFDLFLDSETITSPYFVVFDSGNIIGCGGYELSLGVAGLTWGMVLNKYHGQNIGSKLLKFRLNEIYRRCGSITVKIDTSQRSEGFFVKHGFKTTQTIKNGYGVGLHKVYMQFITQS